MCLSIWWIPWIGMVYSQANLFWAKQGQNFWNLVSMVPHSHNVYGLVATNQLFLKYWIHFCFDWNLTDKLAKISNLSKKYKWPPAFRGRHGHSTIYMCGFRKFPHGFILSSRPMLHSLCRSPCLGIRIDAGTNPSVMNRIHLSHWKTRKT